MLSFADIERLSQENFDALARRLFELHAEHNPVYREWLAQSRTDFSPFKSRTDFSPFNVRAKARTTLPVLPYLPIEIFKHRKVFLEGYEPETEFWSSGTGSQGAVRSTHYVGSLELYRQAFTRGFELAWGKPSDYVFLALLPNYMEQSHSSLVYMMQELIRLSREEGGHKESGFYLHNLDELAAMLRVLEERGEKVVLFGVSYALLDLAAKVQRTLVRQSKTDFSPFKSRTDFSPFIQRSDGEANVRAKARTTLIFETGGMKGRRKEMPKEELHEILKKAFGVDAVYSEYGMCELMSQAYSFGDGMRFRCPPWMRVSVRDRYNFFQSKTDFSPFDVRAKARTTLDVRTSVSQSRTDFSPFQSRTDFSPFQSKTGPLNIIDLANIYSCPFIATQDLARLYPDGTFEIIGRTESSDLRGCNLMAE